MCDIENVYIESRNHHVLVSYCAEHTRILDSFIFIQTYTEININEWSVFRIMEL